MINQCPLCDNDNCILPIDYVELFKHSGRQLRVEALQCYYCINCGGYPVDTDQIRHNEQRIKEEKSKYDNS